MGYQLVLDLLYVRKEKNINEALRRKENDDLIVLEQQSLDAYRSQGKFRRRLLFGFCCSGFVSTSGLVSVPLKVQLPCCYRH